MKMREFGVRLTQVRERRRLSITQLAGWIGVDYMQISRYERGMSLPSLDTAVRLAAVLQITLDELATGVGPAEPPTFRSERLLTRMRELDQIPEERQEIALRVLDTVIAGHELEKLAVSLKK